MVLLLGLVRWLLDHRDDRHRGLGLPGGASAGADRRRPTYWASRSRSSCRPTSICYVSVLYISSGAEVGAERATTRRAARHPRPPRRRRRRSALRPLPPSPGRPREGTARPRPAAGRRRRLEGGCRPARGPGASAAARVFGLRRRFGPWRRAGPDGRLRRRRVRGSRAAAPAGAACAGRRARLSRLRQASKVSREVGCALRPGLPAVACLLPATGPAAGRSCPPATECRRTRSRTSGSTAPPASTTLTKESAHAASVAARSRSRPARAMHTDVLARDLAGGRREAAAGERGRRAPKLHPRACARTSGERPSGTCRAVVAGGGRRVKAPGRRR